MLTQSVISTLGLLFDIVGVLMVYAYVKELNFIDHDEYVKGNGVIHVPDPTEKEIKAFIIRRRRSCVGLGLIVLGFLLQIVAQTLFSSPAAIISIHIA